MKILGSLLGIALLACGGALGQTAFNVTGIADKAFYNNTVTVNVATESGYSYALYLNGTNVASGGAYTIRNPDFYLVEAVRTNTSTSVVTSRLYRIVVVDTSRGDTERGLPAHTPLVAIPSSSNEFAGGQLRLIAPAAFPTGYEIPLVAWAVNDEGEALRANGWLEAEGHPSIFLRRGVGSGLLGSNNPAGALNYSVNLKGIQTNKTISLQSGTTWTPVSGLLSGSVNWPANSRIYVTGNAIIPAGSSLTIGAGSIVRLNPSVTITNNGVVTINGTIGEPVVFMPNSRSQYWGGFQMRSGTGRVTATGTIFWGSGANPNWLGGHRSEQPLFDDNQSLTLTDCAVIATAGQFARDGGTITLTRFLVQGVTSAGEFSGASLRVNDSAFIEVPDDSSNFVNLDNDALYLNNGNHGFTNCLFGWTKDDGIDSGGSGTGTIYYESCWFESIFHEGNSLSGFKDVFPRNTVYIDCGQGHEVGYDAPNGWVDGCLFLANKSGARLGDNYDWDYNGRLSASNSIMLYNHRDVFGYNWDANGWTNASGQMDIRNNWLTKPDTNFPDNLIWNPATDGWRLARFSTAPGDADVGVGMALRTPQVTLAQLTNGIPVRLSIFSTNFVSVDYTIESADVTLASGTLQFVPGEIVKYIRASAAQVQNEPLIRVRLHNPVRAEITANPAVFYTPASPPLIARGSVWKYPNVAGQLPASWNTFSYSDASWQSGATELGFGDGDEVPPQLTRFVGQLTYYFRKTVTVADPNAFTGLSMWMRRDDGAVMYFNGQEVHRSSSMPQPPALITFTTAANNEGENAEQSATLGPAAVAALVPGDNLIAVEIHQDDPNSSDISFNMELAGNPVPRLAIRNFRGDWLLFWADPAFRLQQADALNGPWTTVSTPSPAPVDLSGSMRFYRLTR